MKKIFAIILSLTLYACSGTSSNQQSSEMMAPTYNDWVEATESLTEAMLNLSKDTTDEQPVLDKQSVIVLENFKNETQQQIDTNAITKKARQKILDSGTSQIAVSFKDGENTQTILLPASVEPNTMVKTPNGTILSVNSSSTQEATTYKVRTHQGNEEESIQNNTFVTPDVSITGAMVEKETKVKPAWFSPAKIVTEYYIELTLTDLTTGSQILKGDRKVVNSDAE